MHTCAPNRPARESYWAAGGPARHYRPACIEAEPSSAPARLPPEDPAIASLCCQKIPQSSTMTNNRPPPVLGSANGGHHKCMHIHSEARNMHSCLAYTQHNDAQRSDARWQTDCPSIEPGRPSGAMPLEASPQVLCSSRGRASSSAGRRPRPPRWAGAGLQHELLSPIGLSGSRSGHLQRRQLGALHLLQHAQQVRDLPKLGAQRRDQQPVHKGAAVACARGAGSGSGGGGGRSRRSGGSAWLPSSSRPAAWAPAWATAGARPAPAAGPRRARRGQRCSPR